MAINVDFDTNQKLLRAAGSMNMSVNGLSNLILSRAMEVLDPKVMMDNIDKSVHRVTDDLKKAKRKTVQNGT